MKITYALILLLLFGFTSYAQNDCPEAIIVCGDANYYDLEAIGIGDFPEINFNNACSSGENNSIWLKIQINQGGTLGFILTPEEDDLVIDFDFWLFGPIQDCNDIGTAIRCSTTNPIQAGLDYITTGMNETETDTSEGPGPDGNAFVNWITVQDNEFYFLVVDRPHGFGNFSMEWTGTATFHTVPVFLNPDGIPLDMQQCDKDGVNDNTATFDLTIYNDMFIGNQSPMEITYHDDLDGATTNTNQITSPEAYQNVSNPQTVYLRMTNTVTGCYSIQTFNIEATYPITTGIPENLNLCDSNKNGINTFDLSLNDTNVKGVNPSSSIVTYYTSEEDALSGSNPVGPMFDNQTPYTSQIIWPRLEDADGCFNYDFNTFTINIIPSPIINNPDNISFNQSKCDLDDINDNSTPFDLTLHAEVMKGDQDTVEITYYDNEDDAEAGTNFITNTTNYYNITNPQTIYTRLTDGITGCYTIGSFDISILPIPAINPQTALAECDFNNDGFTQFNLLPVLQQIENDLGNVTVTIHETPEDAFFNVNVIPNQDSYTNIDQNIQTLYIRAESELGCFDIAELQLIANPVPEATTPLPYALCDDGTNDSDGQAIFDLTSRAVEILGSLDPVQYSLTYHLTADDAALGTPNILTPSNYLSGSKVVYVRVTNNTTGCYDIVPLELIVNSLPVLITNQLTYTLCDITTPNNDEKEIFDLTSKIPEFIADQGSVTATFHTTFNDAQDNINFIDEPWTYQNQEQGVETIFVRFTFDDTSCYRIGFLDIRVAPLPIILEPTQDELTVCDTNGQGIGEFDLSNLIPGMMNNEPNLEISFHETAEDAQNGVNAIPNPDNYTNASPYLQFIYVRVVESQYKCFNTFMLTLKVLPAPQAPSLEDLTFCDDADNNGQDGKRRVDLTVQNAVIAAALGLTIPDDLIVEYYTTETGANSGLANRITNPATYMGSDQQVIWVRVEDPVTGCYSVESFMLLFNAPHALTTPSPLAICNEALPNDGQAEFDLTVREDQLLGPSGIGQGYTVEYYESDPRADPDTPVAPIADPEHYTNPAPPLGNPKTLFVKVTTKDGCVSYTTLTIKVLPLPTPDTTPDALVLCDDNGDGDGVEEFDLTQAAADIKENGSNYILTYYTTQEDAQNEINPIADPAAYESGTGSVWVRVALDTHNPAEPMCAQIVELPLIVNPLPPVADLEPLAHCEQNTDGAYDFNIQEYVNNALGGNEADEYDVDFFEDAALTTPAVPVTAYPVTGGSGTVYVRVANNETGCTIVKELSLLVEEGAIANPVATVFEECDYDGANDGIISTWDLTAVEGEVLGTQSPADYEVTYYTSLEDAENYENAIAAPEAYTNTIADDQTIWVRVTNTSTISKCHDITTFTLHVERLAEPQLQSGTLCIDFVTGDVLRSHIIDTGLDATYTFKWYHNGQLVPDETGPTLEVTEEGEYTVIATSDTNCSSAPIAPVMVLKSGPASPIKEGYYVTNAFSDEQIITVTVNGYGQYEYKLDEDGNWQTSNVFRDVSPGSHIVYIKDVNPDGCEEIMLTGVSVIDYPNFFTPNEDTFRDTWNIIGLDQEDAKIYIFDRYGKFLKQISAVGEGWDGTFNGEDLPASDYWFTVTYREYNGTTEITKVFKAHFSLLR